MSGDGYSFHRHPIPSTCAPNGSASAFPAVRLLLPCSHISVTPKALTMEHTTLSCPAPRWEVRGIFLRLTPDLPGLTYSSGVLGHRDCGHCQVILLPSFSSSFASFSALRELYCLQHSCFLLALLSTVSSLSVSDTSEPLGTKSNPVDAPLHKVDTP